MPRARFRLLRVCLLGSALLACGEGEPSHAGDGGGVRDAAADAFDQAACAEECRTRSGGAPVDDCRRVAGGPRCILSCTTDAECEAAFYTGCDGQADDLTRFCR